MVRQETIRNLALGAGPLLAAAIVLALTLALTGSWLLFGILAGLLLVLLVTSLHWTQQPRAKPVYRIGQYQSSGPAIRRRVRGKGGERVAIVIPVSEQRDYQFVLTADGAAVVGADGRIVHRLS